MNNAVDLVDLRKTYRRGSEAVAAVNGVTLSVARGEFVVIVGPSGSGKSTLLHLVGCVEKPDSGGLRIDGLEVDALPERELTRIRAEKIGFVFQQFFLLPTLTVEENIQLPALFAGSGSRSGRVLELLDWVHLSGRARHLPRELSGGEMQRVAIARALINEPKILLADEPTGNLDSHHARAILEIFRELNERGLTVFVVTHNSALAKEAERVIRLEDGRATEA